MKNHDYHLELHNGGCGFNGTVPQVLHKDPFKRFFAD